MTEDLQIKDSLSGYISTCMKYIKIECFPSNAVIKTNSYVVSKLHALLGINENGVLVLLFAQIIKTESYRFGKK